MNLIDCVHAAGRRCVLTLLFIFGSAVPFSLASAAGGVLTLDEAITRARVDAPQLAAARATLEAANHSVSGAGRLPDPELILGVDNLPTDSFSLGHDFMTMHKIGVMQSVPNGAKRRLQGELAAREVDLAEAQLSVTSLETARAAADAWINCAVAAQSLQRLRVLRRDLGPQSAVTRAALASGRTNAGEALSSEAALARLDLRILELEQRLATGRAELARWIGESSTLEPGDLPWRRDLDPAVSVVTNLSTHALVAPAASGVALAHTRVELAKAEKRPDWSAELTYADRGPGFSDLVSLEFRVGLPLFTRNRQNPAIGARLADARAEEAAQEAAIRMHRAEVEAALAAWQAGRTRLAYYDSELLPLAKDRSRALTAAYGAGQAQMRPVLEALGDQAELELAYVELAGEVTRSWVFLNLLHAPGESP